MKVLTDDQIRSNISVNLRRILDVHGWNQSDLARESGVGIMTISEVIRGKTIPGIAIASRVAEALETSIDNLISSPPEKNSRRSA